MIHKFILSFNFKGNICVNYQDFIYAICIKRKRKYPCCFTETKLQIQWCMQCFLPQIFVLIYKIYECLIRAESNCLKYLCHLEIQFSGQVCRFIYLSSFLFIYLKFIQTFIYYPYFYLFIQLCFINNCIVLQEIMESSLFSSQLTTVY